MLLYKNIIMQIVAAILQSWDKDWKPIIVQHPDFIDSLKWPFIL